MHDLTNSIVPQSSSALTEASSDDFFMNFGLKCLFFKCHAGAGSLHKSSAPFL
jgi:hypothetical protein